MEFQTLFKDFGGRETALEKIARYSLYKTMFYRTNLLIHSKRVSWIIEEIIPYAKKVFGDKFDGERAIIMGMIHDDPEIITGDYQAGEKSKMKEEELKRIDKEEETAVETISKKYPEKIGKFKYKELLSSILKMDCLESQIMDYADKFDALGEALHEVYGGNKVFAENVVNKYGKIPTPLEYYIDYLENFTKKFPNILILFKQNFKIFKKPETVNFKEIAENGNPHTISSVKKNTGHGRYDLWKTIILKYGKDEDINILCAQKEFK